MSSGKIICLSNKILRNSTGGVFLRKRRRGRLRDEKKLLLKQFIGSMPEWLMGADCKSAGLPTLVQIQLGPLASLVQLVERRSPKPDVVGSSPTGRVYNLFFATIFCS